MYDQEIAERKAKQYGLPATLVKAIVEQESGGNPWAVRFEPNFLHYYVETTPTRFGPVSLETERMHRATSFGLCQVLGQVARELGFQGVFLTELCNPEVGIEYGCKKLAQLQKRYGVLEDVISGYNAGSPRKDSDGKYSNQAYVASVLLRMKKYE